MTDAGISAGGGGGRRPFKDDCRLGGARKLM